MTVKGFEFLTGLGVPELDGVVPRGGNDRLTVGAKIRTINPAGSVQGQKMKLLPHKRFRLYRGSFRIFDIRTLF